MKKLILLILFVLTYFGTFAQEPTPNQTFRENYYKFSHYLAVEDGFMLPQTDDTSAAAFRPSLIFRPADKKAYLFNGSWWQPLGSGSASVTPTLQQVTDAGSTTTTPITVAGVTIGPGGIVAGSDAVNTNEFTTLGQVNTLLSDIQTATFTPELRGYTGPTTGDPTPALHTITGYTVQSARYWKFGAMVYVLINIQWDPSTVSVSNGSALLEIGDLPFEISTAGTGSYIASEGAFKQNDAMNSFFKSVLVQHLDPSFGQVAQLWKQDATYMTCDFLTTAAASTWTLSIMINYMTE